MAINHIGTMATGGYDGTMAVCGYDGTNTMMTSGCDKRDNYDGSSMKGDGYDRSSAMMADGYHGSNATMADGFDGSNATMGDGFNGSNATMGDGYDGSNSLAICNRGSPSPPPFLSPPTQTAVESGRSELEEKTFQNNLRQVN